MRALIVLTFMLASAPLALAGSETPPKGAAWERDLQVAQDKALAQGKPIFLYFTKTY